MWDFSCLIFSLLVVKKTAFEFVHQEGGGGYSDLFLLSSIFYRFLLYPDDGEKWNRELRKEICIYLLQFPLEENGGQRECLVFSITYVLKRHLSHHILLYTSHEFQR